MKKTVNQKRDTKREEEMRKFEVEEKVVPGNGEEIFQRLKALTKKVSYEESWFSVALLTSLSVVMVDGSQKNWIGDLRVRGDGLHSSHISLLAEEGKGDGTGHEYEEEKESVDGGWREVEDGGS